ncbi:MAG: FAD-dependent oxidoreductase [Actinomycetota bacterium]|nr:FAD-dependent oxidoreductase [Actinomycetota bacterium]
MSEAHSTTNVSYWIDSTDSPDHPPLQGDMEVDVAIIGGGIVGLTAAWLLKRAGKTVAVIEMDRLARGVSGYTTAKVTAGHGLIYQQLASKHGEESASQYARANQLGLELIAQRVKESDIECDFERRPNFVYCESADSADAIKQEVEAARRAGLDVSYVSDLDLPYPIAGAIRLEDQAQFHPSKYLLALAADIPGDGSHVFENSRVTELKEGEPCEAITDGGRVLATDVIMATHYPFWDRGLFFPRIHPKRSYALAGPIDASVAPEGMYISIDQPTRSIRTIADGDRRLLLVGGNGHAVGQEYDTDSYYSDLESWARERFGLKDITHRWSTHDGVTADMLPYAGTARRSSDHVYTATGFGKWGMTNGTIGATVVCDAILGKDNEFASLFDPHRVTVKASVKKIATENAKVAQHWFGDRVIHPQRGAFNELQPGEASVARVGVSHVAGYRDDDGKLHAVSAVCTHLGCTVTWNPAEKSWDCPCHGSRFDPDGKVLHGPALRDLGHKDVSMSGKG